MSRASHLGTQAVAALLHRVTGSPAFARKLEDRAGRIAADVEVTAVAQGETQRVTVDGKGREARLVVPREQRTIIEERTP